MKLKNLFLAVIAAGAALVGCDPENLGEETFVVDAKGEIVIAKTGGEQSFSVTSSFDWNVRGLEDAAEWLDVQVDGKSITSTKDVIKASSKAHEVTVSALANTGKDRAVTLTLFANVKNQISVKVTQPGDLGDGIITTTVAELLKNPVKGETYRLSGTISRFSATYCSFDLTDTSGSSIYVYSMEESSKAEWGDKLKNGGTVTITGQYDFYESKQQHEIVKAVVEAYTAPEGGDPDQAVDATIAEFIQKADGVGYYRLSGQVLNVKSGKSSSNKPYLNFDLADEHDTIYVYNVVDASIEKWGDKVKNGCEVTVRGQYAYYAANSQHEVINPIIDTVIVAPVVPVSATGLVLAVSKAGFLVQTEDGIAYVYDEDIEVKVAVGDNVTVNGEKTKYNEIDEIENYTVTINSSDNELPEVEPTELDAAAFDAYNPGSLFGLIKFTGKLTKSGNYYNIKVDGATRVGSLSQPVSVPDAFDKKYVDVTGYYVGLTGSSTKYVNVIVSALDTCAVQPVVEESADAKVGEDEVGYELTNAEISAAVSKTSGYSDVTIESAAGNWFGQVNTGNKITYLQFRDNSKSYLKSPAYASNVKRIVLRFNEQTGTNTLARTVHAVPVSVIDDLPTASGSGQYKKNASLFENSYGSTESGIKEEVTSVITVTGETKEFVLISYEGAIFLNSILVICEK